MDLLRIKKHTDGPLKNASIYRSSCGRRRKHFGRFTIESPSSRDLIGRVVDELASSTSSRHRVAVAVIESRSSCDQVMNVLR